MLEVTSTGASSLSPRPVWAAPKDNQKGCAASMSLSFPGAKHQLESVPSTLHPCPVLDTGPTMLASPPAWASGFPKEATQKPSPHDCMSADNPHLISGPWRLILSP